MQPYTEGVIRKVFVREGQPVHAGQILAEMENWNLRSILAQAQSKHESALMQMNHSLAVNDGTTAGAQRVQADYWKAELSRSQQLLEKSELRSPIDGIISTPHVDSFAGRKLVPGDSFAEVVDTSQAIVDVAIEDEDAGLLKDGQKASVKLNSYPSRTFHGQVVVISQRKVFTKSRCSIHAWPSKIQTAPYGPEWRVAAKFAWEPILQVTSCYGILTSGRVPRFGLGWAGEPAAEG